MIGRTKGLIHLDMTFKAVVLTATSFIIFSCQDAPVNDRLVTIYPVIDNKIETTVITRATALNTSDYAEYSDNTNGPRQALSVNAVSFQQGSTTNHADKDASGVFAPLVAGGWRSGVQVEVGYDYKLYVYSNKMPSPTTQFHYDDDGGSAYLTFNGLYTLFKTDPLVCVAASARELSATPAQGDYPTLNEGEFHIGTIPSVTTAGNSYKAFIAMDHFYSKATLSFCIDPEYKRDRNIRIKNVEILSEQGTLTGSHSFTFSNNTISLDGSGSLGGNPITIDLFGDDADISTFQLDADSTYYTLTTTLKEFGYFYFLPKTPLHPIRMKVTYDVVDLKKNVTRENQVAYNDHLLKSIEQVRRGHDYQIRITVAPSYLYQLSDDDVDFQVTIQQ